MVIAVILKLYNFVLRERSVKSIQATTIDEDESDVHPFLDQLNTQSRRVY